jgi:hypothetical protein
MTESRPISSPRTSRKVKKSKGVISPLSLFSGGTNIAMLLETIVGRREFFLFAERMK